MGGNRICFHSQVHQEYICKWKSSHRWSWTLAEDLRYREAQEKSPHNGVRQKKGEKRKENWKGPATSTGNWRRKAIPTLRKGPPQGNQLEQKRSFRGSEGTQPLACEAGESEHQTRGQRCGPARPGWALCLLAQRGTERCSVGSGEPTQGGDCCRPWRGTLTWRDSGKALPNGEVRWSSPGCRRSKVPCRRARLTPAMPSLPAAPCLRRHRERPQAEQAHPHLGPAPPQSTHTPGWRGDSHRKERARSAATSGPALPPRALHTDPGSVGLVLLAGASKCCFHSFSPGRGQTPRGGPHAELGPKSKLRPEGCVTKQEEWKSFLADAQATDGRRAEAEVSQSCLTLWSHGL